MGVQTARLPNFVTVTLLCLATAGVFGPHLTMLAFKVFGAQPPAGLTYFCVLSHHAAGSSHPHTALTIGS